MKKLAAIALVVLLAGCGGSSKKSARSAWSPTSTS